MSTRTYSSRAKDRAIADEANGDYCPCGVCGTATLATTLSQYGARCFPCYERYCFGDAGAPIRVLTAREKRDIVLRLRDVLTQMQRRNPRAWIAKLEQREASGEKLSEAQMFCLRQVRQLAPVGDSE
jgi:hypothetical protein